MLKEKIEKALNNQIALEGYSSFAYLAMSAWCDKEGLDGCSRFLRRQSEEERMHMLRIFDYISEVDGHAHTPAIVQPALEFVSIDGLFDIVYQQEQKVTASINDIVALCYEEKDHTTLNFLQWYVEEQREEEALMRSILDKIRLIGNTPGSLYWVDQELEKINVMQEKAAAAAGGAE